MYKFPMNGNGRGPGMCLSLKYFVVKSKNIKIKVPAIMAVMTPVGVRSDIVDMTNEARVRIRMEGSALFVCSEENLF